MNQPARRRTDADATSANQSNVTYIFCGKLNVVQPATLPPPRNRQKAVDARGFPSNPQSSRAPAWRSCRGCKYASAASESPISSSGTAELSPKTKDPSGGTTGRVKPYGRAWGGWALAPNTASMGRDNHSHRYCVAAGSQHVQTDFGFF